MNSVTICPLPEDGRKGLSPEDSVRLRGWVRGLVMLGVGGLMMAAPAQAEEAAVAGFDWEGRGAYDTRTWRGFLVANNRWGGGLGRIWLREGRNHWSFLTEHADDMGGGEVKSFPHAGIGWLWGDWAPNPALPFPLGELEVARSSWKITLPVAALDPSYVIYFQAYLASVADPERDASKITGDLAVVVHRENFPFEDWGEPLGDFEVAGRAMRVVRMKPAIGASTYLVMIPLQPMARREGNALVVEDFDFKACVEFAVKEGHFKATDHLITLQAGWEVRALRGILRSDDLKFTIARRGRPAVELPLPDAAP